MKQKKLRQLMAIMFTDIVGYTALMQQDEAEGARMRARHRAVLRGMHAAYEGNVIQYFGDGTLSIFRSAVAAVQCAIDIQRRLSGERRVPLRIGIHIGDIVCDHTEVYGDAVNVASRIEHVGTECSILISGKLNDELKNHKHISTTSLGFHRLKNVLEPLELFAVTIEGLTVPRIAPSDGSLANPRIAVLPFANMSTCDVAFSEGLSEQITQSLAQVSELHVISRTTAFSQISAASTAAEISKALGARFLLQGSVRHANGSVRVNAQLVDAASDRYVWSGAWERKTGNRLQIQDDISADIARAITGHMAANKGLSKHLQLEAGHDPLKPHKSLSLLQA